MTRVAAVNLVICGCWKYYSKVLVDEIHFLNCTLTNSQLNRQYERGLSFKINYNTAMMKTDTLARG